MLQGLRALTTQNWRRLKTELQAYAALRGRAAIRLADFLHDQALELEDVYRAGTGQGRSGWTALKRDAGLIVAEPGPEEDYFSRRFGDLLHVDDPRRLDVMAAVGAGQGHPQHSMRRVRWACRCWPTRSMAGMSRRQATRLSSSAWCVTLRSPRAG